MDTLFRLLWRISFVLALCAATAALALAAWSGSLANPATLINRVDVIAVPSLLAASSWVSYRKIGPAGSLSTRGIWAGGYAAILVLVVIKTHVERFEYQAWHGGAWLGGLWLGDMLFLVALVGYATGLNFVSAQRSRASRQTLATGTAAGLGIALIMLALPPIGNPLHVADAWLGVVHHLSWVIGVPVVLSTAGLAGVRAAKHITTGTKRLQLADVRTRQAVAAGLYAGATAALLISIAGVSAADVLPRRALPFPPALADLHHLPPALYFFEVSLSRSSAGYLLVLILLPLLGAGAGAWGGLASAGQSRNRGDGNGGGGGSCGPAPDAPPALGRLLDRQPAILSGYLYELPGLTKALREHQDRATPQPDTTTTIR